MKVGQLVIVRISRKDCRFPVGKVVKVFRYIPTSTGWNYYDCCDDNGNCSLVCTADVSIFKLNKKTMKAMKEAVLKTAKELCKANNTVTTLEIKTELRRDYPYYYWDQATISNFMAQFAGDGIFNYTDNGTYRTYSLVKNSTPPKSTVAKKIGLISNSKSSKRKGKTIGRNDVLNLADHSGFQSVIIFDRWGMLKVLTKDDIRYQKKSPLGYIKRCLNKVSSITVSGKTYQVK